MTNDDKVILIKPQVIDTTFDTGTKSYDLHIVIKNFGEEGCVSINKRDIFFDKSGDYAGEGIDLREEKQT